MLEANGDNLSISRGKWFFNRRDAAGLPTGLRFLGEASKGDITPSVQTKEYYTMTKATNNKIANVVTQQKHTLAIDLREFTKENLALALLGDTAALTQSQTTVSNEVIAGGAGQAKPAKGMSYQTSKKNISAVTLVAVALDGTTTTPLVAGTDYQIEDAGSGLITLLSDTAAGGNTVKATTYTAGAITGSRVTAGTSAKIIGEFLFIGDPTSGPKMNVHIWKAEVAPSAALAFLSDDFSTMSLTAEILEDAVNHPTAPLYEVLYT